MLRLIVFAASIAAAQALQMEVPGLSFYSTHPIDTNFVDPPLSSFATLIPFQPRLHSPAAYGPQSGFGEGAVGPTQGQAIPLIREVFEGLKDEYLCGPLPPVLRVNQSLWRIPGLNLPHELDLQRDFDGSGLLTEDLSATPRWPRLPLDLTVAGSILFASRGGGSGGCSFAEKSYWAGKAGAAGLVVYGSQRSADVLYTMGLQPAEFQAFLQSHGENPANYTFPLPSVYSTASSFVNVCLFPFLDGIAKQSIWYRLGQRFLYPNGNPAAGAESSSSGGNGGIVAESSSAQLGSSTGGDNSASSSGFGSGNVDSSTGDASSGSADSSTSASAADSGSSSSTAAARRLLSVSSPPSSESDGPSLADLLAQATPRRPYPAFAPFPLHPSKVLADPASFEHTYELLADFSYLPLWAIIDPASATAPGSVRIIEQVEYGGFRIAAYFLLVVPGIWILVAVIYAVRKCCQNKRAQKLKELREGAVPVVTFKTIRAGSAAMIAAGAKATGKKTKPPPPQPHSMEGKEADEAQQHLRYTHIDIDAAPHHASSSQHAAEVAIHLSPAAAIALEEPEEEEEDSPPQSPSARLAAASSQSRTVNQSLGNEHEVAAPAAPSTHVAAASAAVLSSASPVPPSDQEVLGVGVTSRGQHIKLTGSTCAICLLDFTDGDRLKVLPCSHGFHPEGCINPWLDKSDECPVCRASISDALEVEPACCAWCCDPPRSAAQRFVDEQQQRDAVRQRQARREQAEEADRLREMRDREMEMMPIPAVQPALQHDLEGQQHQGATIVNLHAGGAASSSSAGVAALSAEESEALAARFHVESVARCIADLFSTVRRLGLTPPAELVMLSDQMLQYASAARSGRMDDRAVGWLRRMLGLMPQIHSKLAAARSEDAMDAAAVADSMMQFACDDLARERV